MSYILDALRKSEQQRQLGVAPRLLTVHAPLESDAQPAFLKYGLIAAALIGAGVAIGWWQPWQQARRLPATASAAAEMPEARPRDPLPAPLAALPKVASGPQMPMPVQKTWVAMKPTAAPAVASLKQDTHQLAAPPPQARALPPAAVAPLKEAATPGRGTAPAPAPAVAAETPVALLQEQSADAPPADAAQQQKVLLMAELPAAIRQEIPAMSIPVHTYSDTPTERIVGINDRLLREGEYLAPGLKLELIAPDGVVFSFKNYRFRHGL